MGLALLIVVAACASSVAGGDAAARADSLRTATGRNAGALIVAVDTPPTPRTLAAPPRDGLELSIHLATAPTSAALAPAELFLTSADGRGVGYLPGKGSMHGLVGAVYDSTSTDDDTPRAPAAAPVADQRQIEGVRADAATYTLTVSGTAAGAYILTARIDSMGSLFTAKQRTIETPIRAGEAQRYRIVVGMAAVSMERIR